MLLFMLNEARRFVEDAAGKIFPDDVVIGVLTETVRKWKSSGNDTSYLPRLFENELNDYLMREAINEIGGIGNVCCLR